MKRVFICSPFRGQKRLLYERYARELCNFAIEEGCAPFAPHLLFPQFMDDHSPTERELALIAGKVFMACCEEFWYGSAWGISESMKDEIEYAAKSVGIPVFEIKKDEQGRFYKT